MHQCVCIKMRIHQSPSLICCCDAWNTCPSVSVWFLIHLSTSVVLSWVGSSPTWRHEAMSGERFGCHCGGAVWECHWHLMCEVQGCCYISDSHKTVSAAHSSHQQRIIQPECQWRWGQKPWSTFFLSCSAPPVTFPSLKSPFTASLLLLSTARPT